MRQETEVKHDQPPAELIERAIELLKSGDVQQFEVYADHTAISFGKD